jgi:hypothetical protein
MADDIQLIGSTFPPGEFSKLLASGKYSCFGKHHAKTVKECRECTAPVIIEGELYLFRELCQARTQGAESLSKLKTLTTQDVIDRLQRGKSVEEIFSEILGDADPETQAATARHLLYLRFVYMQRNLELPTPHLPPRKELISHVLGEKVD